VLPECAAVRPAVRAVLAISGALPWKRVGRPAALDPVGWGTPSPHSPRVAGRSGRRSPSPGPQRRPPRTPASPASWVWL